MNCSICGNPIILIPSAAERAKKFGGKPEDYTNRFTAHADCVVAKRSEEAVQLMRKTKEKS